MAAPSFRIVFTESALADLDEIVAYWTDRDEPERGVQYAHDLPAEAARQLSDRATAQSGRFLRHTAFPSTQEISVFKRAYRVVEVWRFWHSHRDEPFQE